jgi:hypothetical protein
LCLVAQGVCIWFLVFGRGVLAGTHAKRSPMGPPNGGKLASSKREARPGRLFGFLFSTWLISARSWFRLGQSGGPLFFKGFF